MFILRDLLPPLQTAFSATPLGRERAGWFLYTLLAVIVPFTSSMTSNLLRTLTTLFGLSLSQRRFYAFMASPTLPWDRLWQVLWGLIPAPLTDGRLVLALDDCINPKVGRQIFGCETIFDHAAKSNQSRYPWAQNVVMVGLLKSIKGRWACLPLAFRFYLPKKAIEAQTLNVKTGGKVPPFETKLAQASAMIITIASHFAGVPVLVVTDSWFGNNGLFKPVREALGLQFHVLSRLRVSSMLYGLPPERLPKQRGAKRKYGEKLGSVAALASGFRDSARPYQVRLYGKSRQVLAHRQVFMVKTLKCPVRVVWVYRKTRWVALFTTDLRLSVEQIITLYGARWKIEIDQPCCLRRSVWDSGCDGTLPRRWVRRSRGIMDASRGRSSTRRGQCIDAAALKRAKRCSARVRLNDDAVVQAAVQAREEGLRAGRNNASFNGVGID